MPSPPPPAPLSPLNAALAAGTLPAAAADVRREIHTHLKQASYDFGKHQFNTVVSAAMKILNALEKAHKELTPSDAAAHAEVAEEGFSILLRLLSPIAPHICHALWQDCGFGADILAAGWPEVCEAALRQDEVELMLQVNGKLRGSIQVAADATKADIEALALANEAARKFMEGRAAKKVVVVPGRLVNIVA